MTLHGRPVCMCVCVFVCQSGFSALNISLQPFSTWVVTIRLNEGSQTHILLTKEIMVKDAVLTTWSTALLPPKNKKHYSWTHFHRPLFVLLVIKFSLCCWCPSDKRPRWQPALSAWVGPFSHDSYAKTSQFYLVAFPLPSPPLLTLLPFQSWQQMVF